jgi:eukaryotic-like serine/threonine-protein kinase
MMAGTRLGPYEILSAIGSGGMGEVYRPRDTKLNRDVAIKLLPESVARDPDYLAHFQRKSAGAGCPLFPTSRRFTVWRRPAGVRAR